MSSDKKDKIQAPAIVKPDTTDTNFTLTTAKLPPALRPKPTFLSHEFVLFPEDIAIVTKLDASDEAIFSQAVNEAFECVIAFDLSGRQKKNIGGPAEFLPVGLLARIIKVDRVNPRENRYTIRGVRRVLIEKLEFDGAYNIYRSTIGEIKEIPFPTIGSELFESQKKLRALRQLSHKLFEHKAGEQAQEMIRIIEDENRSAGFLCDKLARALDIMPRERGNVLNLLDVTARVEYVLKAMTQQIEMLNFMAEITAGVHADLEKQQRDYFIRHQIKALRKEIGEEDDSSDLDEIKKRLEDLDAPDEVIAACKKELHRLGQMSAASSEYTVAYTHLETVMDIPWRKTTTDNHDIAEARRILDADHFGLQKVKQRLLEFLAVRALKPDLKAPILCLYGPPGVGKTSLGKSVAKALGRKFHRISLGGMHDESEIRGHRRTYVASMPGRIVQALRRVQTMNPVIMLDELDKLNNDIHGDPSSALLEVLDPEQNNTFADNYVELSIDLSQVLFITTANNIDAVPGPLRDRLELIEVPGYTSFDKHHIATEHLIPKVLENHGLTEAQVELKGEALDAIIAHYTREAGVRQLEQQLGAVMRKVATAVAEAKSNKKRVKKAVIGPKTLESYLGKIRYDHEIAQKHPVSGTATGLAWTPVGGEILFIETTCVPGKSDIVMTGKLGDVMQESVRTALTLIRARAKKLGLPDGFMDKKDIHIHFPAAATPKDGPSAGSAIFCALLSLFTDKIVPATLAMTGEISLRGLVLPIGGLREKILGAYRAGIKTILFPKMNLRDLDDIPQEVTDELELHTVDTIDQVLDIVFGADKKKAAKTRYVRKAAKPTVKATSKETPIEPTENSDETSTEVRE